MEPTSNIMFSMPEHSEPRPAGTTSQATSTSDNSFTEKLALVIIVGIIFFATLPVLIAITMTVILGAFFLSDICECCCLCLAELGEQETPPQTNHHFHAPPQTNHHFHAPPQTNHHFHAPPHTAGTLHTGHHLPGGGYRDPTIDFSAARVRANDGGLTGQPNLRDHGEYGRKYTQHNNDDDAFGTPGYGGGLSKPRERARGGGLTGQPNLRDHDGGLSRSRERATGGGLTRNPDEH